MLVRIIHKDGVELFTAREFWYKNGLFNTYTENNGVEWDSHRIKGEPKLEFSNGILEQVTITAEDDIGEKESPCGNAR